MNIKFKKGHIGPLDGVRGIAILLVLFFHCFEKIKIYPFSFISEIGWVGVDLFFVLSGFLITGILVDTKGNDNYLSSFFAKRALRIFPLYYLSLLLVFITLMIPSIESYNPVFDKRHLQSSIYYFTFTQNLYFSFNGWGVTDLLNHFWSLAVEEQFYLFWPFVIFYLNTSRVLIVCVLLIIVALITRNFNVGSDFSYVFTLARVDALATGSILAIVLREHSKWLNRLALPVFLVTLITLLVFTIESQDLTFRNPYFVRIGYTLFAALFASIIAFIYDTRNVGVFANWVLSFGVFKFLGRYSYGIYIYHWLLYKGVYNYFENNYVFSKAYIIPFLIIVIIISVISFHTFEKYFLKFKSRFDNKSHFNDTQLLKAEDYLNR
jgi:peptidoglycan/LPS O-acetylase OafA/YrhL